MRRSVLAVIVGASVAGCSSSPSAPAQPPSPSRPDCTVFPPQGTSPYILPYETGEAFFVGRTFEHGDPQRYAIDWLMPTNTALIAARAGRVIAVESRWADDDHTFGHENHVFIQHDDGTVGRYFHVTTGGVQVAVGEAVRRGQRIGRSGNTGNSTAPHLHFDVVQMACTTPWPGELDRPCQRTVPVTFVNTKPNPCGIQTHETYPAGPA